MIVRKIFFIFFVSFYFLNAFNIVDAPNVDRVLPTKQNLIYSYNNSIKDATKAVVNITTEKNISDSANSPFNDPFFQQFFGDVFPKNKKQGGIGSGIIMSSDGYIVTNSHVINGADKITVTIPNDPKKYSAKLIGEDEQSDIAVIKIDKNNLPILKFADSSKYAVGDVVFAIGNPFGVGESVTQGIISALNKSGFGISGYENFIQTDASINPGNSGGALIDSRGVLIGMNTAIISRTGGNHGIGFAIPADMIKNIAISLVRDGHVKRGFLGISIKSIGSEESSMYNNQNGALVIGLQADSAAQKAGIQVWDLITEVDGKKIKNDSDLRNTIGSYPPNKNITLTIVRVNSNGTKSSVTTKKIALKLGEQKTERKANISRPENDNSKTASFDGLVIENLTNQLRQKYRIPNEVNGVLVGDVVSNSKAYDVGFEKGDVISQIENRNIKNISDFKNTIKLLEGRQKRILIYNILNGSLKTIITK